MKISYKNSIQDIIDLNLYVNCKSPSAKKSLKISRFCVPIPFIVGGICLYLIFGRVLLRYIVIAASISILIIIFLPKINKWSICRQVSKDNEDKNMVSNTTLILDDGGITNTGGLTTTRMLWEVVQKVVITEKHILIIIDYPSIITVPLEAFNSITEKNSFLEFVYKNVNKNLISFE